MITCRRWPDEGRVRLLGALRRMLLVLAITAAAGICAGARSPAPAQPCGAEPESQRLVLLAKMVEKEDYFLYRTDTPDQKSPQDLANEEKEKQERSWQLLERTEIYQDIPNPPPPPKDPRRRK